MLRDDWEYESDDDIGEDIGKFEEEEAELLTGIEGGAEGEKKEGDKKEDSKDGDKKDGGDKK